ncbi:MAG: glucose-1-phosphate adenylyltransferase [Acidobacteria bacterium RIFCSPLOWO2_02_FULL_59_13]|nr:MAG: glucose-1-phosphate adenylyltransferase [Acidobacteria bacterium RIFCSPLOWO2_02_FULL_59_13]
MERRVLGMIMAGGKGSRLYPLTRERAKPAVPFGGKYRIVDFVLSNFLNSAIHSVYVLTQFKSQSLLQHLRDGWQFSNLLQNQFIIPVPAQMRAGESWYQGTADAIFQNINLIEQSRPDMVAIFSADHIYRMDIRQMISFHRSKYASATVACLPTPTRSASAFGVVAQDNAGHILSFHEKLASPPEIPGRPGWCLVSMGNYIFETDVLLQELYRDAEREDSRHDFGHDILPRMISKQRVIVYDFLENPIEGEQEHNRGYWRDVGTVDAYYEAAMDLISPEPSLNLYNRHWPIHTAEYNDTPAKAVCGEDGRAGQVENSLLCGGSIIAGGLVRNSILGRNISVQPGAEVENCIVLDNCRIAPGCRIRQVILDKNVRLEPGTVIGYDREADSRRYFMSDNGITVVSGGRTPVQLSTVSV